MFILILSSIGFLKFKGNGLNLGFLSFFVKLIYGFFSSKVFYVSSSLSLSRTLNLLICFTSFISLSLNSSSESLALSLIFFVCNSSSLLLLDRTLFNYFYNSSFCYKYDLFRECIALEFNLFTKSLEFIFFKSDFILINLFLY